MEMMEINSPQLSQSLLQKKKKYTHGFPRQDCDKSCNDAETVRKFATILKEHQKAVDPKQSRTFQPSDFRNLPLSYAQVQIA